MIDSGLIQKVLKKLNLDGRIEQVTPLAGGISAGMTLVELFLPSGKEKWIIRQPSKETLSKRPEVARMEYELLKLLRGKSLPVPSPVYLDETSEIFNTPTLVLEYLPGLVSFSVPAYSERVDQMARMLAAIHNTETSQLTTTKVPSLETSLQGLFVDEPKTMFEDLDEELILSTLNDHLPLLKNEPSVLLHGDYWTGNLLWQDKALTGVIDWEDACMGSALYDLAIARVDQAYTFGSHAAEQFTESYLKTLKVDCANLPVWDLLAALQLIRFINRDLKTWSRFYYPYERQDLTADVIAGRINQFTKAAISRLS